MARLVWNVVGERIFEAGVDHGVLYVDGSDGVAWNGLVSVNESSSGGDVSSFYVDGIKYSNDVSNDEFTATIEAYTYPDEFSECEGLLEISRGLFATQQEKKVFGLCYRTLIGNDVDGVIHAFKLHLVYNAITSSSDRMNHSTGETVDPTTFSWKIFTRPPTVAGVKPTANFVIDSRDVPSDLMDQILDILYGSSTTSPRLPSVAELIFIFTEYQASIFDAGHLTDEYFTTFDAGRVGDPYTSTIDGGTP